jgi:hypothetical protein
VKTVGGFSVLSDSTCSNPRVSDDEKRSWNDFKNDCAVDGLKRWEVKPERECVAIKVRGNRGKGGRVTGMKTKYKLFSPEK